MYRVGLEVFHHQEPYSGMPSGTRLPVLSLLGEMVVADPQSLVLCEMPWSFEEDVDITGDFAATDIRRSLDTYADIKEDARRTAAATERKRQEPGYEAPRAQRFYPSFSAGATPLLAESNAQVRDLLAYAALYAP
jgi:hypothetical protein